MGNASVAAAIAAAWVLSVTPRRCKSSGMSEAAVKHKMAKSTDEAPQMAVEENKSTYPLIVPEKSVVKASNKPVVKSEEKATATMNQLKTLFSKTLAVNHPKSCCVTD